MLVDYLRQNWQRFAVDGIGDPSQFTFYHLTPRFRASSHVISFVLAPNARPVLVAKVQRYPGPAPQLQSEATNLRALASSYGERFNAAPEVLAFEEFAGQTLLLQSIVKGGMMTRRMVRAQPEICVSAVTRWLLRLTKLTSLMRPYDWFYEQVEAPLETINRALGDNKADVEAVSQTREIAGLLRAFDLPAVFEHGDLCAPNIFLDASGEAAIVDWELAHPHGLPMVDLFFFLNFVGASKARSETTAECLKSFEATFFNSCSWTRDTVMKLREACDVPIEALRPLFVLCWCRYTATLISRMTGFRSAESLDHSSKAWLRRNRYYRFWHYALANIDTMEFI